MNDKKKMKISDFYAPSRQKFLDFYKYTKLKSDRLSDIFLRKNIHKFVTSRIFKVTFAISVIIFIVELLGFLVDEEEFVNSLNSVIEVMIGGEIGLLGFIIAGVTLLLSTVNDELLDKIDRSGATVNILSLFFSFYYIAAIIAASIILLVIADLIINIGFPTNIYIFSICAALLDLIVVYSLVYSVTLIGTCIKITILRHKYWEDMHS